MRKLFNGVMRVVSTLIGLLLLLMGGVWTLQGLDLAWGPLRRSFMENDRHWAIYGVILMLVGLGQAVWSNTRQTQP